MTFCSICSAKTEPLFDEKKAFRFYKCPQCEAIMKDSAHYIAPDEERSHYEKHENTLENEGYVAMFERFMDFGVTPFIDEGAQVLEFGSGPEPVLSELLRRRGYTVGSYDPFFAPKTLDAKSVYDAVTSTEVFEHFHDPLKEMDIITKQLKPGGILAVMTQFHPRDDAQFLNWWYIRDVTHVLFFTPKTFEVLAAKFGMRVVKHDGKKTVVLEKL